jgi:heme-degrading monooxygenase HmoA
MITPPLHAIAVIFVSQRTDADRQGYAAAATTTEALVAEQPGYLGHDAARGSDGVGITVSYWADEAAAAAWRDHPEHVAIRQGGRDHWYDRYAVTVARVERGYAWPKT